MADFYLVPQGTAYVVHHESDEATDIQTWARILIQFTIYRKLRIGRCGTDW